MRIQTFTAILACLLLNFHAGFGQARAATSTIALTLTSRSEKAPYEYANGSVLESRDLGIADIPTCGIGCLVQYVPASGCSLTDTLCVCTHGALNQQLSACMLANCTMADTLGTARVNAEMCALSNESQRRGVIVYTITVYAVALSLVALRVTGKLVSTRLAWNDAPIVAAVLLAAIPIGCVLAMAKNGFGEHLWNLADDTFLPIMRYFYIAWSTYVAILGLIKLSLIIFYLDVFPTRSFKILGWIVFWYITINTLILFLLTIFTCSPVSAFWDRDLKGKCMDIQKLGYANSISAIVQDAVLVVLPTCYLRKLQMKWSQKLAVAVMFLVGSFGCITTVVRLNTLLTFMVSVDPTWDYVPIVIWTELEITAVFACVSLPAIRVLFVKILPRSLKGWLSEVTHGSTHQTPRQTMPREGSSKRDWQKDDTWIYLTSTELNEEGKGRKLGFLPSAETSTSQLKRMETKSTFAISAERSPAFVEQGVVDKELPRTPVTVRSKFSM